MLKERLRILLNGNSVSAPRAAPGAHVAGRINGNGNVNGDSKTAEPTSRHSNGLDQFFSYIKGEAGLSILDMGRASQANISFITELGHRLCAEDFLRSVELGFAPGDAVANQSDVRRVERFLENNLAYPPEGFDGALVWNTLEYIAPTLLAATIDRLYEIVKPNCYLLAFFHTEERAHPTPVCSFRISGPKTLLLTSHEKRRPVQLFNNRALENLFRRFQSVKLFLTRDHLREVIVKR